MVREGNHGNSSVCVCVCACVCVGGGRGCDLCISERTIIMWLYITCVGTTDIQSIAGHTSVIHKV